MPLTAMRFSRQSKRFGLCDKTKSQTLRYAIAEVFKISVPLETEILLVIVKKLSFYKTSHYIYSILHLTLVYP